MIESGEKRIIVTPRRSKVSLVSALLLLVLSAALLYFAYQGWQTHVALTGY